jgi:hypothetical protein
MEIRWDLAMTAITITVTETVTVGMGTGTTETIIPMGTETIVIMETITPTGMVEIKGTIMMVHKIRTMVMVVATQEVIRTINKVL